MRSPSDMLAEALTMVLEEGSPAQILDMYSRRTVDGLPFSHGPVEHPEEAAVDSHLPEDAVERDEYFKILANVTEEKMRFMET